MTAFEFVYLIIAPLALSLLLCLVGNKPVRYWVTGGAALTVLILFLVYPGHDAIGRNLSWQGRLIAYIAAPVVLVTLFRLRLFQERPFLMPILGVPIFLVAEFIAITIGVNLGLLVP